MSGEEPGLFGDGEGAPIGDGESDFATELRAAGERRGVKGRPKGAGNRHTAAFEQLYYAKGYRDPLLVLGEIVSADPRALQRLAEEDLERRIAKLSGRQAAKKLAAGPSILDVLSVILDAADRLAPYLHGKKPIAVDLGDQLLPLLAIMTGSNQLELAAQLQQRRALTVGTALEGEVIDQVEGGTVGVSENNGLAEGGK